MTSFLATTPFFHSIMKYRLENAFKKSDNSTSKLLTEGRFNDEKEPELLFEKN